MKDMMLYIESVFASVALHNNAIKLSAAWTFPTPARVVLMHPDAVLGTHSGGKLSGGFTFCCLRVARCFAGEIN